MIKAFYKEMGQEYQEAFRDTLPAEMQNFYDDAVTQIKKSGTYKAIMGEPDPNRVKYMLENSFDQVALKTDKMALDHIRSLRQISAEVFRDMSLTGNTRQAVSKALYDRAMTIPGFEFIDKSGQKWSAKSYFKMLARTELMNAGRASYDEKMAQEGFDVMKLSTSGNSCDKCARFEGKLFSLSGATPGLPTKADLEAAGVFHPNCTHSYSMVPPSMYFREYKYDEFEYDSDKEISQTAKVYKKIIDEKLSNGEKNAIHGYTTQRFTAINGVMRNILRDQDIIKEVQSDIVQIRTALDKIKTQENIKVFRGTHGLKDLFPGIQENADIHQAISDYIQKGNSRIRFKGFTSCSVFEKKKNYGSVNFEIDIPKGTPGAYIESLSNYKGVEYEFLVSDTVEYKIIGTRFDKTSNTDYILLRALIK